MGRCAGAVRPHVDARRTGSLVFTADEIGPEAEFRSRLGRCRSTVLMLTYTTSASSVTEVALGIQFPYLLRSVG